MIENKYKECQKCKKVFKLPVSCRNQLNHYCPFCNSENTGYISPEQYKKYRLINYIHKSLE